MGWPKRLAINQQRDCSQRTAAILLEDAKRLRSPAWRQEADRQEKGQWFDRLTIPSTVEGSPRTLRRDERPYEEHDLVPQHPARVKELRKRLTALAADDR